MPHATNGGTTHIASGVAGGVVTGAVLCSVDFASPTSGTMQQGVDKRALDADSHQHRSATPQELANEPDHALDYIREFCYSYVSWVPGGHGYLDGAFKDIEVLKQSHKDEVNHIVKDIYEELQLVANAGFSFRNVRKTFDVFARLGEKCSELAGSVRPSPSPAS